MENRFFNILISGGAYFALRMPDNTILYTRSHGMFIADTGMFQTFKSEKLNPPLHFSSPLGNTINIALDGMITELKLQDWQEVGYIRVNLFPHPDYLLYMGDNLYAETPQSGSPTEGIAGSPGAFAEVGVTAINMFPSLLYHTEAVLRLRPTEFEKMTRRANIIRQSLLSVHILFPNPEPPLSLIEQQTNDLTLLMAQVAGGHSRRIGLRDRAANTLYLSLQRLSQYVNRRSGGLAALIMVTGYLLRQLPTKQTTPPRPTITTIEPAPEERSARISIMPLHMKRLIYDVQISTSTAPDARWTTVLSTGNSRKLIVNKLPLDTPVYFRVAAISTDGCSDYSQPRRFVALR